MKARYYVALALAVWVAGTVGVRPVYAYLDPGTGSFLFQLVIGVLVGAGFLLKVYWKKVKGLFTKQSDDDEFAP